MRRSVKLFPALLAALALLCAACTAPPSGDPPAPTGGALSPAPEGSPSQETSPSPEVSPSPEGDSTPQLPAPSILDGSLPVEGSAALRSIPHEWVESGLQQGLLIFQGSLVVYGTSRAESGELVYRLTVLSLETGEILHQLELSHFAIPDVRLCDRAIAVTDWSDGKILLLDGELETIGEYRVRAATCPVYVSPDATRAYAFHPETGIKVTHLASGETEVLLPEAVDLYSSGRCGDGVAVLYTDAGTMRSVSAVVDLSTGTVAEPPFSGALYGVEHDDGVWLAGLLPEEDVYFLGDGTQPLAFRLPTSQDSWGAPSLLEGSVRLLVTTHTGDDAILALYDGSGAFLSQCTLSMYGASPLYEPVWSERLGGYFFLVTDHTGSDRLFFWDLSVPTEGEDLALAPWTAEDPAGSVLPQALYDRADALSQKYGLEVRIAELADETYLDHTAERALDEAAVSSALDVLEEVLAGYPEDFFAQLTYGQQQEIQIHLTGPIAKTHVPEDSSGFTHFVGFAEVQSGRTVMAADITAHTFPGALAQTLHHEIFHLIDHKLAFAVGLSADPAAYESGWAALNPPGFAYLETRDRLPDADGFDPWFIDLYSRTFAKEDRARIMEHAAAGQDWAFLQYPQRLAKLDYLCRAIREHFDTTGWPERTVWEETLARCSG